MRTLPVYPDPPRLAAETTPPLDADSACGRCGLGERKDLKNRCMVPELSGMPSGEHGRLLVITSAPGEVEDRQGRPLMGATGQYIRGLVQSTWPGEVVFDHAVRCAPGAHEIRDGLIDACRPYIAKTLEIGFDRVICFGLEAVKAVMGRGFAPTSCRRGYAYLGLGTPNRVPVFFLISPGQASRNRFLRQAMEADFAWALTTNPPTLPLDAVALVVESPADAEEACDEVRDAGGMTLDLETFGAPGNREHRILNMAITPYGADYAYVWERDQINDTQLTAGAFKLMGDPTIEKCGHNLKFDQVNLMLRYGVKFAGHVEDTRLLRRMYESNVETRLELAQSLVGMGGGKDEAAVYVTAGVKELKRMVADPMVMPVLFGEPVDAMAMAISRMSLGDEPKRYAYAAIPADIRTRYNATDTVSTDKLREHLLGLQWAPGVREVWTSVGVPLHHAIAQMEHDGIAVDMGAVKHLQAAMAQRVVEAEAVIAQYGTISPSVPSDVGRLLYEELKLGSGKKTPTGRYSTDADTLREMKHPAADAILAWRRATKFKTQYAEGMAFYVRDDGRIHPSVNLDGTETGRLSCSEPNLFNIPGKGTDDGKLCRDIFVAPEGSVLLEADYSQIEIRVAAMLSQDPAMIAVLKSGVDFHLATAKMIAPIFNIKPDDVDKDHWLRTASKTVNFGTLYGEGPMGIAMQLKTTKAQAVKLQEAIFGKFGRLKAWIDEQLAGARRTGYCRTWWDGKPARLRMLYGIGDANDGVRESTERASWNTPVQGTATEFTNASLGALHRRIKEEGLPAKLVLTVYDSILLEVEQAALAEVAHLVREVMTSWNSDGVPITIDMKSGPAWGSLSKLEVA